MTLLQSSYKKSIDYIKANFFSLLAIFIFCICFVFYVLYDNTPPHWDGGRHFYNAFHYWEMFKNIFTTQKINGITDSISTFVNSYYFYPPGYYIVSLPFMAIFGRNYNSVLLSNLVWIFILCFSWTNWLKLQKLNKVSINIGLFFLLGSPFLIGQIRETMLDIPSLSMIFLILFSLEKLSTNFNTKNILFFSFSMAFGLLVKWSMVVYIPIILFLYTFKILFALKDNKFSEYIIKITSFIYISVVTILGIAGSWYISNLTKLNIDLKRSSTDFGIKEGDPQGFSMESFYYYVRVLLDQYFWLIWVLFLLSISIILLITIKNNKFGTKSDYKHLIFISILSFFHFVLNFAYLMLQSNKDARFAIVLYPSIALFFTIIVELIVISKYKPNIINKIEIIGFTICLFYILNLTLPIGSKSLVLAKNSHFPITVFGNSGYTNPRSQRKDWAMYSALQRAGENRYNYIYRNDSCNSGDYWNSKPTIGIDFDSMPLHSNFGTVWGLSEEYGLEMGDTIDACFVIVARNTPTSEINTDKYVKDYQNIASFDDWQGFNMILLQKK